MINSKVGLLIICRLNSKRLDKKIFKEVNGKSLLEILIIRLLYKFNRKQVVICSSSTNKNMKFKRIAKKYGVKLFYGDDKDIFLRMINAAKKYCFNNVVRITGDNPLTDMDAIVKMSNSHILKRAEYTYTTNLMIGTRPEIIKVSALKKCRSLSYDRFSSEYMTYFFLRKKQFKINRIKFKEIIKNQNKFCVTVDYNKEYLLIKKIFKNKNFYVNHNEVLRFLSKNNLIKKIPFKRFVPVMTKKYNVRLTNDRNLKYIDLKSFGYL
jgi:spore coat polysaccharide biosynthesis protein SpsF (cytidylyltransferase family)